MLAFLEKHFASDEDQVVKLHRVVDDYARNLVAAVARDRDLIDEVISALSHRWKLYRINRVDRNILRMAIAEIANFSNIPGPVILNEAIEIGKRFGGENSASFINGILDRVQAVQPRPSSVSQLKELLSMLDQPSTTG
jgi:N utilization substance protein B